MSTLEITRIDPHDDAAVDRWWETYAAAERADRGPETPVWTREECRSELQQDSEVTERRAYLARQGEQIVGSASLALPLKDNTHIAHVAVSVAPPHRRRGTGTALLSHLEEEARAGGRTTVQALTSWPHRLGPDGTGAPGREFARRHGYALALGDLQSTLSLPVDTALLDELEAEVSAPTAAYALRSWVGPIPEEFVEAWTILDASLETEAPTGELDLEPQQPDVASIREHEELMAAQRRVSFGTIALTGDGQAAAYTQIVVSTDGNAYQWGTLVRAADRGHRLGLAVKAANLRSLTQASPQTRTLITYNAESNAHMLAVNARFGFRPSERMGELQKRLA